jgi:diacylglycerol O-acyltransferase / wax synthase
VRTVLGGTVNDIVLALCSAALRQYLIEGNELPSDPLIAMVPMSVRAADQKGAMGNRVSQLLVRLATNESDPVARLEFIKSEMAMAKEQLNSIGADTLSNWAEFAAPALAARAARMYSTMGLSNRHKPIFNVTISNVPGPQVPLYSTGGKLVEWYPMGPIFDGIGLNMTVMSYLGVVYFGLLACRETTSGLWEMVEYVEEAMVELEAAAASAVAKGQISPGVLAVSAPAVDTVKGTKLPKNPAKKPTKKQGKNASVKKASARAKRQ